MYNIYTLNNGLRVVTEYIEHVKSISVGLFVENGSRNENKTNNGISHFIEHMFFKGTVNRSAKKIAEEIENVGGQINAYTSKESTCYYVKTLDSHIDLCLDVLSDMLFNSLFDDKDIKVEQGVVIEEINMSEDSPEDVLSDLHCKAAFGDGSLAYPILGSIENVKGFTSQSIKNYMNEYYTPKNCVISICGKFNQKDVESLVEKYFGSWRVPNERKTIYKTHDIKNNYLWQYKDIEQLHMSLGMNGLPIGHELGYSLVLVNNLLGGVTSSLMFQKIREELGLCYSVYSYILSYNQVGTLNIYAGLSPKYTEKVIDVIKCELDKFIKRGISSQELIINKEKIKANYILGLESTSSRMFSNGKSILFLNNIRTPDEVVKRIDKINMSTINEVMDICLKPGIKNGAFVARDIDIEKISLLTEKEVIAYNNSSFKV